MKNAQNIMIAVLVVSAVLLTGVWVAMWTETQQSAQAGGEFSRYWGMVGCVGQVGNGADALYMIDVDQKRLNVYVINTQTKAVDVVKTEDLVQAFR